MESDAEIPDKAPTDPRREPTSAHKMITAKDMRQIEELFREADTDGKGLDIEQFCVVMQQSNTNLTKDSLTALHMQIDANCHGTVTFSELLDLQVKRRMTSALKNQVFQKPAKMIPGDGRTVVRLLFRPFEEDRLPDLNFSAEQTRTYQRGQYLSINSSGTLNFWSDSFDTSCAVQVSQPQKTIPFSHVKKMRVRDMVYLKELRQLAIATSGKEVLFYRCNEFPDTCEIIHSLIEEENVIHAMNYWSNGTKAVLSCGDAEGFLSVFISNDVQTNGLFCSEAFEKISPLAYSTVLVSKLLKNPGKDFLCVKLHLFHDICSEIRYFPELESFAVCSSSSKTMVLAPLPKKSRKKVCKTVFNSRDKEFFTCVDYSPNARRLVTGGRDGLLRVWFPHNTKSCEKTLQGHVKPITHIECNHDNLMVTLSVDKNVCVWSQDDWLCMQSFQAQDMGEAPISSMCYNTYNNELLLANSFIGKYPGTGPDTFEDRTSHDKPLCCALYHSVFKQVVSVCQKGVVRMWDLLTAKTLMQFKVTPEEHEGPTAMSFDGPQRRLITASPDGKVRLWNFNNGKELKVLPVTVHREVTSMICRNNRVFVSGRNSKVIFDLDLEGRDNRFLEHECLSDISSMDVHKNTLVATSSKGNTVIWDADTTEVLFWLNTSRSPRTHMADERAQGQTGSLRSKKSQRAVLRKISPTLPVKKPDVKISPLICLKTREVKADTATLLKSADGYIEAWSVINKGGLLGKFKAVNAEGAVITTMSTDVKEQILVTGECTGKVCLWDIQGFGFKNQTDNGPFEDIKGWQVSLCRPPLLRSWRSHLTGVVSVKCDPACENIITAGLDCNVRLWTNTGHCVRLFGKDRGDATQFSPEENAEQEERPESPTSSSPLPNYEALCQRAFKLTNTEDDLLAECQDIEQTLTEYLQYFEVNSTQQSPREVQQDSSSPCPPDTTATTGCPNATNSSLRMQQYAGAVNQRTEQSSPQPASPYLNQTTSKYGCVLNIQQRDTWKGRDLTPCPPNPLPGKNRFDFRPNRLHSSPLPDRVQLTYNQSQLKPHPPPNRLIRGGTELEQSSPQPASPYLNQTTSKYGCVLKAVKGSDLTPCPPTPLPGQQWFDFTPNSFCFPPISDRVQLTHNQSQLKPHPPPKPAHQRWH